MPLGGRFLSESRSYMRMSAKDAHSTTAAKLLLKHALMLFVLIGQRTLAKEIIQRGQTKTVINHAAANGTNSLQPLSVRQTVMVEGSSTVQPAV